jgi:hypothetical protein
MNKAVVAAILVGHGAYSSYAVWQEGYFSVFPPFPSLAQTQMFLDIAVACTLALVWIAGDLRARGKSAWGVVPWLIGVALLGSISPLIYLLARPGAPAEVAGAA